MLLGFHDCFAPMVEDGSKTHSIRGRPAKVGEVLHCYAKPRQKGMRLLGRWVCSGCRTIHITRLGECSIDGTLLTADERNRFALSDGFRPVRSDRGASPWMLLMRYWRRGTKLPFSGYVIYWNRKIKVVRAGKGKWKAAA